MRTLNTSLLSRYQIETQYSQFTSPPNLQKAQLHRKAVSVGRQAYNVNDDQLCQCCQNPINKQPLSLFCKQQQLKFLGTGYVLFFKLSKYTLLILLMILIFSGSGYYFIAVNACQVQDKCLKFFGFPLIIHQKSIENIQKFNQKNLLYTQSINYSKRNLQNQISKSQSSQIQILQERVSKILTIVGAILIFITVILIKKYLFYQISEMQNKRISPENYTIMIQNLPVDELYSQAQLSYWGIQKLGYKPIYINIAYDLSEWQSAILQREKLTIVLNKLNIGRKNGQQTIEQKQQGISNSKIMRITNKINQLDRILDNYNQKRINCRIAGTVFFTFQTQQIANKILQSHQFNLIRQFFNSNLAKIPKQNLLYKSQKVIISSAPAPRQVIWQNLSFRQYRSFLLVFLFVSSLIIIIIFAFQLQFYIRSFSKQIINDEIPLLHNDAKKNSLNQPQNLLKNLKPYNDQIQLNNITQSIFLSIFIITLNLVQRLVIYFFAQLRKHSSYTNLQSSFCLYFSLTYIFNVCFMVYMIRPTQQDSNLLLLQDIHFIILVSAISQPFFKLFNPFMWINFVQKQYIKSLNINKNPYTQGYVNRVWAENSLSIGDSYHYLTRTLFITCWYAYCAPLGIVFSLVGICIDYWVTKYMLLRVYKAPETVSRDIAMLLLSLLDFLPLFYVCGIITYNYNIEILKTGNYLTFIEFILKFPYYQLTLIFLILSLLAYSCFSKNNIIKVSNTPYKKIEYLFTRNYQTENPITKYRGQLNYLSGLAKNAFKQNINYSRQGKAIRRLLQIGKKSSSQLSQNKSQITKLKKKLIHKLTIQSNSSQFQKSGQQLQEFKYLEKKNINQNKLKKSQSYQQYYQE